jgi:hypothetical protein
LAEGALMIPAVLEDHTVTVYRKNQTRGPKFREAKPGWAAVAGTAGTAVGIQVRRERREDGGPGEAVAGEYKGFSNDPDLDVQEGDVLDVTAGPESPATLKVEEAYRPRNHHTELVLSRWQGSLT